MVTSTSMPEAIVDVAWLSDHLAEVTLADVRWYLDGRSGRAAYEAGHLPGALFVDLDDDLSSPDKTGIAGRHPLPTPESFASSLGRLGIGAEDFVVAYDDSGGGTAGRLVWMLRSLGQPAALLDGGLSAWPEHLEEGPSVARLPVFVHKRPWPAQRYATVEELEGATVLDARSAARFRGEPNDVDTRSGHIPGSLSLPWTDNLDPTTGRFLPVGELRRRFEALGAGPGTVCSCGSGVSACANLLALERAGLGPGRLFVASWSGWTADPDRPVATGDGPD